MKTTSVRVACIFASLMLVLAGVRLLFGYGMDPDGHGFYDAWHGGLYLSAGITLALVVVMAKIVKRLERRFF